MHERFVAATGFVTIPKCASRYSVNLKGIVIDSDGTKVPLIYIDDKPSIFAKYFNCTAGYIYDAIKDGCFVRNRYKAQWL